jgi:hypothetical protein
MQKPNRTSLGDNTIFEGFESTFKKQGYQTRPVRRSRDIQKIFVLDGYNNTLDSWI